MSEFWKALFKRLGTQLLTSTAYHPQTDCLSERTNQTVEIALRYEISSSPSADWVAMLPSLQSAINNSVHSATND